MRNKRQLLNFGGQGQFKLGEESSYHHRNFGLPTSRFCFLAFTLDILAPNSPGVRQMWPS